MALPAGRYGVTKEQLRKIKRLPINTIGMITETKEGIAIVEDGAKASQLITAGRQFWHNGKLYSADVDIAKDADIITSGEGKNATEMPNITDQLPGTDAEKANEVTIARVENGSNPAATINEGEQFYHSGILYTATQDIATTDTITPNTNCRVSDSVTSQIASLDAQKADNSVIAPVENQPTCQKSDGYAVGEHFIRNGKFCTVTQAISSGGTLTEGTNYTAGDVASEFGLYIPITNNAGFHNSIFRGKNLGSSVTAAQKNAIANGSFKDLYIGDYWEINSVKYRIAHFDYWLNCGDGSNVCTDHHVVVVPDSALVNKRMNAKVDNVDTTAGAYVNSEMRTTNLADAKTIVNAAFGADNILGHREYMQNAVTDGYESAGAWANADIELMSEIMVYGSNIYHNVKCGTAVPNLYTVNKTQLALFRLDSSYIICKNVTQTDRSYWWLRDVVSATAFADVAGAGTAANSGASNSNGVRPVFGIK